MTLPGGCIPARRGFPSTPRLFEGSVSRHAGRLLGFANAALVLEDEKFQLRSLAAQLSEAR